MNKFNNLFCHKVIPLTYDNSLSYYEVLCKVVNRLNELYSNTEDMITEILDEMGIGDNVRFRNVYNVKDYGAKGDGSTDDRMAIQEALNYAYENGGGIVFVPVGHYIVSKCIVIGDNCFLVGTGKGSIIDLTDVTPYWGTAVAVVGSDCGCCNMKLLYAERPGVEAPIVNGPAWGALGITNCDYYAAINQSSANRGKSNQNIIISDIWTEGFYSIQVEPTGSIENVLYRNLYCQGSIVSIQGGTPYGQNPPGTIKNVVCNNINCDYFRILGSNYVDGVFVYGLKTHYIYSQGNNVHFDGFMADCRVPSPFDGGGSPIGESCCQFFNYVNPAGSTVKRCSACNGEIIGRDLATLQVGLGINAYSKYTFENISIKGFKRRNVSGALNSDTLFISCDAEETGIVNSPTGKGIANRMGSTLTEYNNSWTSVYSDVVGDLTFTNGYNPTGSDVSNSQIIKNGNVVFGNVAARKTSGSVALQDAFVTLPFKPASDIYCSGFMLDLSIDNGDFCPAIIKIDTNGVCTLNHNARHTPSRYNSIYFAFTFSLVN